MKKLFFILTIIVFSNLPAFAGGKKMSYENENLKKRLSPIEYSVTQENKTEKPFENKYWDNYEDGIYVDIVTGKPLFSSKDKFKSGTGWPSFSKPIEESSVSYEQDNSLFMKRTEVRNKDGNSHLGHVFNDGPKDETGLRYCINSASLKFIPVDKLEEEGYGQYLKLFEDDKKNIKKATFGAGCFWGVQHIFDSIKGVVRTTAGYTGGEVPNPSYEFVSTGKTNHAEAVLVEYDANIISYDELLDYFWRLHNPTTKDRQGPDVGKQYRSVIFYHNEEQKEKALKSKQEFDDKKVFDKKAVTEITKATNFYPAEEYHQKFIEKTNRPTCHILRKE